MCNPTFAMAAISAVSAGIQYKVGKAAQEEEFRRQKRQNDLAKKNAVIRYASAQLKIRQKLTQAAQKDYVGTMKARKARAKYIAGVGDAGGLALHGSVNTLLSNYYRVEGNYRNAIRNNMAINISQFERNLEAIQFGQKAQSTYVQPPNPNLLFVSGALNVANTYYGLQVQKELRGLNPDPSQPNTDSGLQVAP